MVNQKSVSIYARVSTDKQKVDMQIRQLKTYLKSRKWRLHKIYKDEGFTGSNTNRPAFSQMMADAQKRKFDVLLVWKLDRLSRSLKDLVTTLDYFSSVGIDFVSYSDGCLDTTTSAGRMLFNIMGSIAEFERDIISERVKAGLENARAKGKSLGRPKISKFKRSQVKKFRKDGLSIRAIQRKTGVSRGSISNILHSA